MACTAVTLFVVLVITSSAQAGTAANGTYCFSSSECASGYCDGATETCQPRGGGSAGPSTGGSASNPGQPGTLENPLESNTIEGFLLKIIDVLLIFALPIVVFFIMYAGFLFVTARGNESQIETAKKAFTWAVVGGVIALGARAIINVIQGTITAF